MHWSIAIGAAVLCLGLLKIVAHAAAGTKSRLDALGGSDPIVSAFAWIDRVTGFRRT